jgi:hypothetical protein
MDAKFKRRICKVAFAHFALSIVIYFSYLGILSGETNSDLFWAFRNGALALLQPQTFGLPAVYLERFLAGLLEAMNLRYKNGVVIPVLISVPVWSLCFSWIFIRIKDWLNHFPVLGRKIF